MPYLDWTGSIRYQIRIKCSKDYPKMKLEWARYEMARDWVRDCAECNGWVLVCDFRDLYFQTHPFKALGDPRAPELGVSKVPLDPFQLRRPPSSNQPITGKNCPPPFSTSLPSISSRISSSWRKLATRRASGDPLAVPPPDLIVLRFPLHRKSEHTFFDCSPAPEPIRFTAAPIKKCYDDDFLKANPAPMLCSGSTIGNRNGILRYLDNILKEYYRISEIGRKHFFCVITICDAYL